MKSGIHPQYYNDCAVTCACGQAFTTGSTKPQIRVDICSACHPFFTGKMKFVDTLGRVEKFQKKLDQAKIKKYVKKASRHEQKRKAEEKLPQTLKEMLMQQKRA